MLSLAIFSCKELRCLHPMKVKISETTIREIDYLGTDEIQPMWRWYKSITVLRVAVGAKDRWIVEVPSSIETNNLLKYKDCESHY